MCMNTATSMEYHGIFIGIVNDRRIRLSRITYLSLPWALPSHATPQLIVAECDDYVTSNDAIAGELHGCWWNLCLELKRPQGHSSVKALGINFCAPVMSHATFWGSWYSWNIPKYERIASYSSICRSLEHGTCLFAKVGVQQNEISQNVRDWTPQHHDLSSCYLSIFLLGFQWPEAKRPEDFQVWFIRNLQNPNARLASILAPSCRRDLIKVILISMQQREASPRSCGQGFYMDLSWKTTFLRCSLKKGVNHDVNQDVLITNLTTTLRLPAICPPRLGLLRPRKDRLEVRRVWGVQVWWFHIFFLKFQGRICLVGIWSNLMMCFFF